MCALQGLVPLPGCKSNFKALATFTPKRLNCIELELAMPKMPMVTFRFPGFHFASVCISVLTLASQSFRCAQPGLSVCRRVVVTVPDGPSDLAVQRSRVDVAWFSEVA